MIANWELMVPLLFKRRGIKQMSQTDLPAHDLTFLEALGRGFYWNSICSARGRQKAVQTLPVARGCTPHPSMSKFA